MGTGRTTQRVVCPNCGELLKPTPELLLGLDGIACKCGFRAADRLPGAQHPKGGPTRLAALALAIAGGIALLGGGAWWLVGGGAGAWVALGGAVALGAAVGQWRAVTAYAQCRHMLGDMIIRRSLVDGVRRIYREEGDGAARTADRWLRAQGVNARLFRRDLKRDARGMPRA